MKRDIEYHRNRAMAMIRTLTLEEKLKVLYGTDEDHSSLGLKYLNFFGEAAHGVQARHDQNFDLGEPVFTTVFPNPIGMSASFDTDLMYKIGEVTGIESRSLLNEGLHSGICVLAPTVDMERDPRWGRNEEAYGEDPRLTSEMAGAYILGMAGEEEYVRCGATLKHFYGNNVENKRFLSDSRIPEELKESYYLRVFREIVDKAAPLSAMTSYNLVNGIPSTFSPEVIAELKDRGVVFIVSDANTLQLSVEEQKAASDGVDAVCKALNAGIDIFLERGEYGDKALVEALKEGKVQEASVDTALINKLTAYSMLGLMPEDLLPDGSSKAFSRKDYNITKVDTSENRRLARTAAAKSTVLLKNDGLLPLREGSEFLLLGPLSDRCPIDWYSGITSHQVTVKEGLGCASEALYPLVRIRLGEHYAGIRNGILTPVETGGAETFRIMLWDDSRITIRSVTTGGLLTAVPPEKKVKNDEAPADDFILHAYAREAFSWMTNEAFQLMDESGNIIHFDAENALRFWEDPRITGIMNTDGSMALSFETVKTIEDLIIEMNPDNAEIPVIACFGLHPIVNCKEERDRESIELPPFQRAVLRSLRSTFDNIILLLLSNAPLAVEEEDNDSKIRSILWSAFGSEELGNGLKDIIFGITGPSGRLPQTWYRNDLQLGDMDEYDLRKTKMTYLYIKDEPLYRFGYGLEYSDFQDILLSISREEQRCDIRVINTGNRISDHVVQLYRSAEGEYFICSGDCRGKASHGTVMPAGSILEAFSRVHDMKPGEERIISLSLK